jgi:hypothetical protein
VGRHKNRNKFNKNGKEQQKTSGYSDQAPKQNQDVRYSSKEKINKS